jgi:hypothetical protein
VAVRPNTDGKLTRNTNLPVNNDGWTLCLWTRITSTEAAVRVLAGVEGAGGIFDFLLLDVSAALLQFFHNAGGGFSSFNVATLTLDTWYFVAIRMVSGTQVEVLYRAVSDPALSTTGVQTIANTPTPVWTDLFLLGSSTAGEEWSNGEAHSTKLWNATLTSTEILAESHLSSPVRTSNIDSYLSLLDATDPGDDESGNARDWTPSGTFATVDLDPKHSQRRSGARISSESHVSLQRRRAVPFVALGAPVFPSALRGRSARADAVTRESPPLRRELSLAALAGAPPPASPPGWRRGTVRVAGVFGDVGILGDAPARMVARALPFAALPPPAPPGPAVFRRLRIDVRRNRARVR